MAAALALATSVQFMVSSHWVLIDPLLMLFTTLALYAASRIVEGGATGFLLPMFYCALVLALWTKGLVGPVLIAAGLLAYAAVRRSTMPIWRMRPVIGIVVLTAATGIFAALVDIESGFGAVREWFWVNHVQRFTSPTDATGHDQPFYYYLTAIPTAVFPWLVPFLVALLPRTWRSSLMTRDSLPRVRKVFLGMIVVGMALVLSASATKRSTYLLPMLPPMFILLAAIASEWWASQSGRIRSIAWTAQLTLVALYAVAPPAFALVYFRSTHLGSVAFMLLVAALTLLAVASARLGNRRRALAIFAVIAVSSVFGVLVIAARLVAPVKDLQPFVASIGAQVPPTQPIYVFGDFDETIRGIVPFATGRNAVLVDTAALATLRPTFVLIHAKNGDHAPVLDPPYELRRDRRFGSERYLALWERVLPDDSSSAPGTQRP
jgi:4-amino-4-deoxy-L-arabinose transferase-like glycosyltransferase